MAFADSIRTARPTREDIAILIEQAGMGIPNYCTSVSGTNTITATCSSITAYAVGQHFWLLPAADNVTSGGTTLNINSLGAKNCRTKNGRALLLNMLKTGIWAHFVYDGTNMILQNVQQEWADYTPTFGASAGTWAPGINMARYQIRDDYTTAVNVELTGGNVSSTPGYLTMTLPFTAKNVTNFTQTAVLWVESSGTAIREIGVGFIIWNTSILNIYRPAFTAFATGNARIAASFEYMGGS